MEENGAALDVVGMMMYPGHQVNTHGKQTLLTAGTSDSKKPVVGKDLEGYILDRMAELIQELCQYEKFAAVVGVVVQNLGLALDEYHMHIVMLLAVVGRVIPMPAVAPGELVRGLVESLEVIQQDMLDSVLRGQVLSHQISCSREVTALSALPLWLLSVAGNHCRSLEQPYRRTCEQPRLAFATVTAVS